MKHFRLIFFVVLLSLCCFDSMAQSPELKWKADFDFFFDNTEYARSTITNDQTMAGIRLSPEVGLSWEGGHTIFAGVSALQNFGSKNTLDEVSPIGYYRFTKPQMQFYAGIFPRKELLSNYSDFFFQDSVTYYVPTMQGLFWQIGKTDDSFFNLWLDWNGKQAPEVHEAFFIGASAYKKLNLFFVDFQSYLFHFANTDPRTPDFNVCDNALAQLSAGIQLNNRFIFDDFLFSAGVLSGFERERNVENQTYIPTGFVARLKAEAFHFGIDNKLYIGESRMKMYTKFGNALYWSNPFLRSDYYLQSRLYWNIFTKSTVQGRLAAVFHYSEGSLMSEQVLTLRVALGN